MKKQETLVEGLSDKVQNLNTEMNSRIYHIWKTLQDVQKEARRAVVLLDDINSRLETLERKQNCPNRGFEPQTPAKLRTERHRAMLSWPTKLQQQ